MCFKDMSTLVNVCFQKTDRLPLPLNIRSPKDFFKNFCSRSFLMNIIHTGAGSDRCLIGRSESYPLKQQYSLIY